MDLDWHDLDERKSVAYALGYCLTVTRRPDGHGYNASAMSIQGEQMLGFAHDKDASQMQAEGWLKQEAANWCGRSHSR